jgi:cystathionine beta-lyase
MKYDFNAVIDRHNTNSIKWDFIDTYFPIKDLLPMWVADMDFRVPPPIIEAAQKVAEHGIFGYSGIPDSYYDALIQWMKRRHSWHIEKEWIVFTPGVVPSLHLLIRAFTQPGDQVVVQTPVYYPFFDAISSNGCERLDNTLQLDNNHYVMDLADLEKKITPRTRMIILCSPHNPVGRVWTKQELMDLGELCIEHDILIVSDEIHEDIVYPGHVHIPFHSISPDFADKCIICTGASKTFNLPGLQVSNIVISNPRLRERFQNTVRSCGIMFPNIFGIAATEAAYRYGEPWVLQLLEYLQGNITFMEEFAAKKIPNLQIFPLQGTYLAWLDFRKCGIVSGKLGSFVREDAKVGLEAGTIFGCTEEGFERMNIACPRSILEKGLKKIEEAVTSLRK